MGMIDTLINEIFQFIASGAVDKMGTLDHDMMVVISKLIKQFGMQV